MIKNIYIKNYALIREETINFSSGLNIIMGETGAGKSMIISALDILLGGRAATNMVRNGETKAIIEAMFTFPEKHPIFKMLAENNFDYESNDIIVRREFLAKGGSRSFLCDTPTSVAVIKEFRKFTVDFHGQHEHQSLLDNSRHGEYLDKFAESEPLLLEYTNNFQQLKKHVHDYRALIEREANLKDKIEFDRLRLDEINKIAPKPDENRQLEVELNILQNVERINELTGMLDFELYVGDKSVYNKLHEAIAAVKELTRFNKDFTQFAEELSTALVSAKEVATFAKEYSHSLEFNPHIIEEKRQRFSKIRALEKKYGTLREILKLKEKLEADVNLVDNFEFEKADLRKKIDEFKNIVGLKAQALSEHRRQKGEEMATLIVEKLSFLGIENPQFLVDVAQKETSNSDTISVKIGEKEYLASASGIDTISFLISTNLGQEPQPLQQIASGGEISRIMLSIKSLLAKNTDMPVLVFDEIDTGISGRIARKTGIAMSRLAREHQILSITHLPQIAALGDNNIIVEKFEEDGETYSQARNLSIDEKINQTAKLLGDGEITESTRQNATELIESYQK